MTTLTVTSRGQVTFRKEVLQHLGIKPGEKIEIDLLPEGRALLNAARPAGTIDGLIGLLAGPVDPAATPEERGERPAGGGAPATSETSTSQARSQVGNRRARKGKVGADTGWAGRRAATTGCACGWEC